MLEAMHVVLASMHADKNIVCLVYVKMCSYLINHAILFKVYMLQPDLKFGPF